MTVTMKCPETCVRQNFLHSWKHFKRSKRKTNASIPARVIFEARSFHHGQSFQFARFYVLHGYRVYSLFFHSHSLFSSIWPRFFPGGNKLYRKSIKTANADSNIKYPVSYRRYERPNRNN